MLSLDRARLDRELRYLGELAEPLAAFLWRLHQTLTQQGFTREEALRLVEGWQEALLRRLQAGEREIEE